MRTLLLCAAVLTAGPAIAAGLYALEPVAAPGQKLEYVDGLGGLEAVGTVTEAAITFQPNVGDRDRLPIVLMFGNRSTQSINVVPSSVTVTTQDGRPIRQFSRAELTNEAQRRGARQRFWSGFTIGPPTSTEVSGTIETPGEPDATFTASVPNPAAAAAAEREHQTALDAIAVETAANVERASLTGFVPETLSPGENHMTATTIDRLPKNTTGLVVRMVIGPDTHVFRISVARQ